MGLEPEMAAPVCVPPTGLKEAFMKAKDAKKDKRKAEERADTSDTDTEDEAEPLAKRARIQHEGPTVVFQVFVYSQGDQGRLFYVDVPTSMAGPKAWTKRLAKGSDDLYGWETMLKELDPHQADVLRFLNDHDVFEGRPTGVRYILEETPKTPLFGVITWEQV